MNSRISSAVVPRSTAAKVVGMLGVVAAAGAVAGLGTFGGFSTSDAVDTEVRSGVLSIDLDAAAGMTTVPFSSGAMLPGDVEQVPFDLVNDGDVALSSVRFGSVARESSLLDSDLVHGLQMDVQSCSVPWTASGSTFSCAGALTDFYAGPIVMDTALTGAKSLNPGGVDHLVATVSFPADAGDRMRLQTSRLTFTFTAAQRDGAAR
ncbi:hypothetical protein [Blastococcus xanthinilyticus]|uniref:Camelysin-like metallo-endopeptidase n=1 Tax=Blastococcus xanthinilyticus TaxID=1564164 RepID=A0A5S5CXY5_9ACTN|nr:hypothetical protein [Blastococcus xanthinilyticus]TYP87229.1 hypothetical protein BD833_107169 [Blastococcus xanthinilyticus]